MCPTHADDQRWMRAALQQARYGAGRTSPNPSVGCVIVKDGRLVGFGRTADGGRPHAETQALEMADSAANGATAYVTLEPCAHHGQTPPCVDALIASGIARVAVGAEDPDKNVSGKGISCLQAEGIAVDLGTEAAAIASFYQAYFHHRRTGLPFVTAKIASTLDGKIALADGQSKWITGARTRHMIHLMRSEHDAILTSTGTVRADNPSLTARVVGYNGPQPLRVIVGRNHSLDDGSNLLATRDQGDILMIGVEDSLSLMKKMMLHGVDGIAVPHDASGYPDIYAVMHELGERGITSVMVEAGGQFLAAILKAGLIDKLVWTRSSGVIGGEGQPSFADLGLADLAEGRIFTRISSAMVEDDAIEVYLKNPI